MKITVHVCMLKCFQWNWQAYPLNLYCLQIITEYTTYSLEDMVWFRGLSCKDNFLLFLALDWTGVEVRGPWKKKYMKRSHQFCLLFSPAMLYCCTNINYKLTSYHIVYFWTLGVYKVNALKLKHTITDIFLGLFSCSLSQLAELASLIDFTGRAVSFALPLQKKKYQISQ